jgi:hypothetical protein
MKICDLSLMPQYDGLGSQQLRRHSNLGTLYVVASPYRISTVKMKVTEYSETLVYL